MFAALSLLAVGLLALSPSAYLPPVMQTAPAAVDTIETLTIPSFDAYPLEGRLYLPPDQPPSALVIYVNGSGPNTNQNTRQLSANTTFSYFDLVASGFNEVGAAFFSYSTRGVTASDTPPFYHTIDPQAYQTYLPKYSVQDVAAIVRALRTDSRLHDCPIYLLGWSEGTMIAPKVAQLVPVDGLLLAAYVSGTMQQALDCQQTSGSSTPAAARCHAPR